MPTVKVAAGCIEVSRDRAANLAAIRDCMAQAAAQGVQLLVLPECAVQGYPLGLGRPDLDEYHHQLTAAETVPGPATQEIAAAAAGAGLQVVVGLTERPGPGAAEGSLYNTAALIDGTGVRAAYRKIHTGGVEKCLWSRGSEWVVADSVAGRIGLMICYDLVFPETARCLCLEGAEILAMSTAWATAEDTTFARGYDLFTRSRALENQVFLISSNLVGGAGLGFHGHSRIVSPRGEVLAETAAHGLAVAALEVPDMIHEARARSWFGQVFLRDREPAAYSALARTPGIGIERPAK